MKHLIVLCAACGVGKSTIGAYINEHRLLEGCVCIDTDEVGVNWWDYADSDTPSRFHDDCIRAAVRLSGECHFLFGSCMNPPDFYTNVHIPAAITATHFIALTCSDEEVARRLKARPAERMCGSDAFIAAQVQYNQWIRAHRNQFQFHVDNTGMSVAETARQIADFVAHATRSAR